ncbi:TPA: sensor histidine kinase [Streptococcus agalactiae]
MQKMTKLRRFRFPLRFYFTLMFVLTMLFSVLASLLLVAAIVFTFFQGVLTTHVLQVSALAVVFLSLVIASISMWYGSYHLTKPILDISYIVSNVADGDFEGHIYRNSNRRKSYEYYNELDELSESINQMIVSLSHMDHMRKDFITNVSHELKTPIAAVANIVELLQDPELDEETQSELLGLVKTESLRLTRLCDTMLQMSRVDNQETIGELSSVRVDEQIRQAMISLTERWQAKRINFQLDSKPYTVYSNSDLLMQVWINLLDNAIKYSEDIVDLSVRMEETNNHYLRVIISDKGRGISQYDVQHIFDKFYQADQSHNQQGNGLGLAIVKRIIVLCKGRISVSSQLEIGTEFCVELPLS